MTLEKLQQLIAYYKSSKNILKISSKNSPEKFDGESLNFAIGLFDDVLSILYYLEDNLNVLDKIVDIKRNPLELESTDIIEDK